MRELKPLGNQNNPAFATVAQVQNRQTPKNLRDLEPNTRYRVNFEASAVHSDGTPQIAGAIFNTTKGKHWTGSTWATTTNALSGNSVFTFVSGFNPVTSATQGTLTFKEYTTDFTTDYSFEKGDSYQLWITPINLDAAHTLGIGVRDIETRYEGPPQITKSFYGADGNKLFPNQEYDLNIRARVASLNEGLSGVDETLRGKSSGRTKTICWERLGEVREDVGIQLDY